VIENAGKTGKDYGDWLGDRKAPNWQEKLRQAIDNCLASQPAAFDDFLCTMKDTGYEIKHGKYLAFRVSTQKKFTRCRTLGDDYTEQAIRERIEGKLPLVPSQKKVPRNSN